ncbi:MAG: hypothetical protein UU80_C0018G0022 [candidate division WWE3 bacterium GW2011_GWA1_41_8]|uniref:Uncharacterized protein n=1 Tax=candidate division WWE3 bacterium GW2011_GWA1_41_8 TaxID=1619103 RepID=A0A0G0ZIL8_UNCKA|nr:MAG: hypothetical protein UU80_C0018G0022 [candidate division WWE3 bacterium GW2011_GWA1_41_8]
MRIIVVPRETDQNSVISVMDKGVGQGFVTLLGEDEAAIGLVNDASNAKSFLSITDAHRFVRTNKKAIQELFSTT